MIQAAWPQALLDPDVPAPAGLTSWNGSDPVQRFAVYRNNVIVSLVDALADTFPATQSLLGEEFFRAMAREFVRANPPRSPVLTFYGQEFPAFIAAFPPAFALPYLPDLARLELAYVSAFFAADAAPLDAAALAAILQQPDQLVGLVLHLHPSLSVLSSPFAVVSLWAAHQGDFDISEVHPEAPEGAWVLRHEQAVKVLRMSHGDCRFISAIQTNTPLGPAAEMASQVDTEYELTRCLTVLLREQAVIAYTNTNRS
jgi:hypothetical protein